MSHPRLSRRGVLIGGVAALAAVGGGSSWALDRFVIDHPQVSNVSDLEAQASSTATSTATRAPSVAADEPTIAVTTWTQGSGTDKVTGYVADVTTPDASFLRTAFAEDTFGTNIVADPSVIAAQVGATLAINGDYYGFRDEGIVIRNGIAYRDAGARTGLALHGDGTLALYDETSTSAQALVDRGVWQTWSFGPGLVVGGVVQSGIDDVEVDTNIGNHSIQGTQPRTGIGMISPNHYLLVVVDGRASGYSRGVTMSEFAEMFAGLGAQVAYNLDGGGSSTMVYRDALVNNPLGKGRERGTSDIIWL